MLRGTLLHEEGVTPSEGCPRALLEATTVIASAELTGARYAALGVIDRSGRQLERFPGMSVRVREVVEREPEGMRVDDAAENRIRAQAS